MIFSFCFSLCNGIYDSLSASPLGFCRLRDANRSNWTIQMLVIPHREHYFRIEKDVLTELFLNQYDVMN